MISNPPPLSSSESESISGSQQRCHGHKRGTLAIPPVTVSLERFRLTSTQYQARAASNVSLSLNVNLTEPPSPAPSDEIVANTAPISTPDVTGTPGDLAAPTGRPATVSPSPSPSHDTTQQLPQAVKLGRKRGTSS
jgi:hypothetical protein